MGVLKWTPDVFWNATIWELEAALDGHMESAGKKRETRGMTHARYLELIEQYPANG